MPAQGQTLSAHLDRILEMDAQEAAVYLDGLRSTDQQTAAELERLLDARQATGFAEFLSGDAPLGGERPATQGLIGRAVGAYVIDALVGQGGMGNVWRAHRADGRFDTTVAIKFLNVSTLGSAAEQRFRSEGRLLGRLDHPHIARLIDAGLHDATQPYLVLEFVQGEPIDEHCRRLGLDLHSRLRLILDVLDAVSHAHRHLIVHRDLKPSNIMVTREGAVKLLDFGIATLLDSNGGTAPETLIGARALTPMFAAPEQIMGRPVTTATDVYAMGVVSYLLLTGHHPLAGADQAAADGLRQLLIAEPRAASRMAAVPSIAPRHLDGDIDNILAKSLKKDPAERYDSAQGMADDWRRYLSHEPVLARADSAAYRVRKFVRRHRAGVAVAAVMAGTLIAATVTTSLQMREAERQRAMANAQSMKAEASAGLLRHMIEETGSGADSLTPVQLVDRGVYLLDQEFKTDTRAKSDQLELMGALYDELGEKQKSYDALSRAAEMARRLSYTEGQALALLEMVEADLALDHAERAPSHLAQARTLIGGLRNPSPTLLANLYVMTAVMKSVAGDFRAAVTEGERALALLRDTGHTDALIYSGTLTRLSDYYDQLGNAAEAHRHTELAGQWMDSHGAAGTIGKLNVLNNSAADFMNFGEVQAAADATAEVMRRLSERGDPPATRASFGANRGAVLSAYGDHAAAIEELARAIADAAASHNVFWQQRAEFFRARTLIRAGRYQEGRAALDAIETAYRRDPVRNEGFLWSVAVSRAELLLHTGKASESKRVLMALFEQIKYPAQTSSWVLRAALPVAAETALSLGDADAGRRYAQSAVTLARQAARDAQHSADVGRALVILARAEHALGRSSAAAEALRSAQTSLSGGLGAQHPEVASARALAMTWQVQ